MYVSAVAARRPTSPRQIANFQLIKVSDDLIFPCSASQETLRCDIYSPTSLHEYALTGTVTNRLNVISDPRQIKEHLKGVDKSEATHAQSDRTAAVAKPAPAGASLVTLSAYVFAPGDAKAAATAKFLSFLALGPMTRTSIEQKLNSKHVVAPGDLNALFSMYAQPYLQHDSFTEHDMYPLIALDAAQIDPNHTYYILKDKAYKDLRPWACPAYSAYERGLIIENANNALTRLGFLETHPLRRRIVDKSLDSGSKKTALGGGLLTSSAPKKAVSASTTPLLPATSPASPLAHTLGQKRAATASPKLDAGHKRKKSVDVKDGAKRFVASLSLSSSEDEKQSKEKKEGKRSNSSGSNNSMNSMASTHSNGTSYTLPSSTNDEPHEEQSEEDVKLLTVKAKPAASLPSRPLSAVTGGDKKHMYYAQLAEKFRQKYQEYEQLYTVLSRDSRKGTGAEKRKSLMKLFELHSSLAEWKQKLWDYHNEHSMAEGVMNLSKHRKTNSGSGETQSAQLSPFLGVEKFHKAHTSSPAVGTSARFHKVRKPREPVPRAKMALDY